MDFNFRFTNLFYNFILIILVLSSVFLFAISLICTPSYFLKFSADNYLTDSTLEKIAILENVILLINILFLIFLLVILYRESSFKEWIFKYNQILKNILLLLFVLILFFISLELIIRLIIGSETSESGFGPGSINFNKNYVFLNNEGFRGKSFSLEKPNDTLRIAVIGDSFTFGSGINDFEDTYSRLLEKKLNSKSKNKSYEVLTFALPGRDTPEEIGFIKNNALKYKPDIILIGYVLNDFIETETKDYSKQVDLIPFFGFFLRQKSYSYYFLETRMNRLIENVGFRENFEKTLISRYNSSVNQEYNQKLFEEIKQISNKEKIPVYIVIFPMIQDLENYSLSSVHVVIKNMAAKENFPVLDLLEAYKPYKSEELIVNPYDRHPNEFGHEIAAENITEFLEDYQI